MKKTISIAVVMMIIIIAIVIARDGSRASPLNATYVVRGEQVKFNDGAASIDAAPGSASRVEYRIFGEPTYADLDRDGDEDAAMFMTEESGGSGTFYYVAVAVNDGGEYKGTEAMYLGDRIAPQTIDFQNGRAVANYADRNPGEPFSTEPSVGKSVWIHLDVANMQIGERVKDFEGESNL